MMHTAVIIMSATANDTIPAIKAAMILSFEPDTTTSRKERDEQIILTLFWMGWGRV